jgi:outer membrane lipoprotein LolB
MTRRRLLRAAASGALLLLLSACFDTRPENGNSEQAERLWQARQAVLQQVTVFSLQGRLAETGLISFSGDLSWIQNGGEMQLRFYGPLGVGAVGISGNPDGMEIHTKDGVFQTHQPEQLMQEQFGWSVPVEGLRYWVLGLPAPSEQPPLIRLDENGRILSLKQGGWELSYSEYQPGAVVDLPRKFTISDSQRGFRVVIDSWTSMR